MKFTVPHGNGTHVRTIEAREQNLHTLCTEFMLKCLHTGLDSVAFT